MRHKEEELKPNPPQHVWVFYISKIHTNILFVYLPVNLVLSRLSPHHTCHRYLVVFYSPVVSPMRSYPFILFHQASNASLERVSNLQFLVYGVPCSASPYFQSCVRSCWNNMILSQIKPLRCRAGMIQIL